MMIRYARSYSLQKGPSLEDSVEQKVMNIIQILKSNEETYFLQHGKLSARNI